jgi:two-component system OmpR family sensor kinase
VSRIPIRLRVALAFALVSAVVLAALGYFVYARFDAELSEQIDQGLRTHGDDIASLVANGDLARNARLLGREESFAQVLTPDGRVYASTPQLGGDPQLTPEEAGRASEASFLVTRDRVRSISGEARLLARPADGPGGRFVVLAAASLDDRHDSLANLGTILLIGIPVALLLASIAGYLVSGRALRPVEAMRRRAAAVSAGDPEQRLPLPEADDEIRRLGETLNEMLGRLEAAIERERAFVDDASHELRTPLAMHKTELELALRYAKTPDEMRAAISSAIVEVDRLIQLAEDLLVLARSAEGKLALDLRPVGMGELLGTLQERFSSRMKRDGRSLVVDPANGLTVEGDRLRLEQALTNLVENAIEHGRGEITVRAQRAEGEVTIHVEDLGPGFAPEFIGHAFERFSRGDASRRGAGTGLGLAIVDAIARAHRGSAHASNREDAGADVWIQLPH